MGLQFASGRRPSPHPLSIIVFSRAAMDGNFLGLEKGFLKKEQKTAKPKEKATKAPHPKEDATKTPHPKEDAKETTNPTSGASSSDVGREGDIPEQYMMLGPDGIVFSDHPEGLEPFTSNWKLEEVPGKK